MISRRDFLRSSVAAGTFSILPTVLIPSPASASYAAAGLAVAGIVAGMIAGHNRRDVNAIYGVATRKELRNASLQLASLQEASAVILTALADLPEALRREFAVQSVRELHRDIAAAISRYDTERESLPRYPSYNAWMTAKRHDDLKDILRDLRELRSRLQRSDIPIDPSACTVMSTAAGVELSIINHLGYDRNTAITYIESYERYFGLTLDSSTPGSAAAYLAAAENEKSKAEATVAADPLGKLLPKDGSAQACLVVSDYRPSRMHTAYRPSPLSHVLSPDLRPDPYVPERIPEEFGRLTRLSTSVAIETVRADVFPDIKKQIDKIPSTTKQILIPDDIELKLQRLVVSDPAMDSREPSGDWTTGRKDCPSVRRDMSKTPAAQYLATIRSLPEWRQNTTDAIAALGDKLDKVNVALTKIELGKQSVECSQTTLSTLARLTRSYL